MNNYNKTDYPNIFIKTYWGSFTNNSNNSTNESIIQNRNKFIEEFNIQKVCTKSPKYIYKLIDKNLNENKQLDHIEIYKTNDGKYILISSPYIELTEEYIENGWTQIYNLYTNDSYTYIKII